MDCITIVKEYLESNGYQGLAYDNCGCPLDGLVICDNDFSRCEPGHKAICKKCGADIITTDPVLSECNECL